MSGKVISVVNMKGGVGKTTTVVSLSETLATDKNSSILVIDIDTQASASYCLAGDKVLSQLIRNDRTIDEFFQTRLVDVLPSDIGNFVRVGASELTHLGSKLDISLLASSPYLRHTEREIIYALTQHNHSMSAIEGRTVAALEPALEQFKRIYDYTIFDCAPGISVFTVAALTLSDLIIIPTIPDFLSSLGLYAFVESVLRDVTARRKPGKTFALITRKNNTTQHSDHHLLIKEKATEPGAIFSLFDTVIPESAKLPKALNMIEAGVTTYRQKYESPLDQILLDLATEVKEALHDRNT